jgi:hypothetical protein
MIAGKLLNGWSRSIFSSSLGLMVSASGHPFWRIGTVYPDYCGRLLGSLVLVPRARYILPSPFFSGTRRYLLLFDPDPYGK